MTHDFDLEAGARPRNAALDRPALALLLALVAGLAGCARAPAPTDAPAAAEPATGIIVSIEEEARYDTGSMAASIPLFFDGHGSSVPEYAVRKYAVYFTSRDFDGSQVLIRSQLFVPEIDGDRPLYVFASGTTGIGDLCAPSLEVPEQRRWGWYEQNMLAYASAGFIVMFPDYTGFNDPDRPQRYFSRLAEGRMMLDAIRAAIAFFPRPGTGARPSGAVFTAGYSQGGHAAMAAADLRPEYAPELPLSGIVTYGSTNDVEALLREGTAYAPLVLYSYMSMYGPDEIRPADYLKERWLPSFEQDASTMAVDVFQYYYGFDYKPLYTPAFAASLYGDRLAADYPALSARLAENHTGLSGHRLPALVVQGGDDFIVTVASQEKFVAALREAGSDVVLNVYPGINHRFTRMAGFGDSVEWMRSRAAETGKPF